MTSVQVMAGMSSRSIKRAFAGALATVVLVWAVATVGEVWAQRRDLAAARACAESRASVACDPGADARAAERGARYAFRGGELLHHLRMGLKVLATAGAVGLGAFVVLLFVPLRDERDQK
jgi:hypothetical protein